MKKVAILLLLVLANGISVEALETYRFTFNPGRLKKDTITVYDERDSVVLMYGKDIFVYRQNPITVSKDKRKRIFSSQDGELGRVSSKKYKKISLADGSTYDLVSGIRKLSYKKDGRVCASSEYYCGGGSFPMWDKVYVEMSIDTDLNFTPFLFQGVLAHINGIRDAEQLIWLSLSLTW